MKFIQKKWMNFGGETNNRSLKVWKTISATKGEAIKGLFELSLLDIQKLKKYAQSKVENKKVSTFAVTCAYLLSLGVKVDQQKPNKAFLVFGVDCRSRLDPPINANYFGNCIMSRLVVHETEALLEDGGFISALKGIIDVLNDLENSVLSGLENWMSMMQSKTSRTDRLMRFFLLPGHLGLRCIVLILGGVSLRKLMLLRLIDQELFIFREIGITMVELRLV